MAITVQLLTEEDCLQPEDWVRPLTAACSELGTVEPFNSFTPFAGLPQNHFRWVKAREIFGDCWMGFSLKELQQQFKRFGGFQYEVLRGPLPKAHYWDWQKDKQRYEGAHES